MNLFSPASPPAADARRLWLVFSLLILTLLLVVVGVGFGVSAEARLLLIAVCSVGLISAWLIVSRVLAIHMQAQASLAARLLELQASTRQIMANVSQRSALRAACQTARAISQADYSAVFLLDDDGHLLQFTEGVGRLREQSPTALPPFSAHDLSRTPYYLTDASTLSERHPLRAFMQQQQFRSLAQLPLYQDEALLGYLLLFHAGPHLYTAIDYALLDILANQTATALDNERLLKSLELYAFEMSNLEHLGEMLSFSLEPDKLADAAGTVINQMLSLDYAALALIDSASGQFRALGEQQFVLPLPTILLALADGPAPHQYLQGEQHRFTEFMAQEQLGSLILMPLTQQNGTFGLIVLGAAKPRHLNEHEQRLLLAAAGQISLQLYNAAQHEKTQQALDARLAQLAQIERIVQQISSSQNFGDIISNVLEAAAQTTQADTAALGLLTEADDLWVIQHRYQGQRERSSYLARLTDAGVIGKVTQYGELLVSEQPSALAVPLIRDDEIIGALEVTSQQNHFFTPEQGIFLKSLAAHATISIQNARLLEELHYQVEMLINLRELSLELSSAVETTAVASAVLEAALRILDAQYAVLFRYDARLDKLTRLASRELAAPPETEAVVNTLRQAAYRAAATGSLQIVEAAPQDGEQPLGVLAVPVNHGGQTREVLGLVFTEQQHFQARDLNTLSLLAIQAAGHLENATLHERIREGNDRMRAILDSTRDGVILLDENGRLAEVNPAAERLLGINLGERLGDNYLQVLLQRAGDHGCAGYTREELQQRAHLPWVIQEQITRRQFERNMGNQTLHLAETSSPVMDNDNRVAGRLLTLRDVSEEKELEAFRNQFTNLIYHDLRSPMVSVQAAIKIAQIMLPNLRQDAPTVADKLEQAVITTDNLLRLINDLMMFARLEAQQLTLNFQNTAVNDLAEAAYRTLQPSIQEANITVDLIIPPDLPPVRVDEQQLQRVLINLLDNALRYTPAGGRVQISAVLDKNRVLMRVADSGPGIPEGERDRIFEKYRQVKGSAPLRGSKGTGLGLTFCKLILEAHGQTIWVEAPGPLPGACFAFAMPTA